jgi:hypothetical protein
MSKRKLKKIVLNNGDNEYVGGKKKEEFNYRKLNIKKVDVSNG